MKINLKNIKVMVSSSKVEIFESKVDPCAKCREIRCIARNVVDRCMVNARK